MKLTKKSISNNSMKHKNYLSEDDSISLKFISKILKIFGENLLIEMDLKR
jgi:hypothetical protein